MISKILSCRRRVLEMQAFNFSSSYHLLLAHGRDKSMIHQLATSYKKMYDLSSYKWRRFRFSNVMLFISCNTITGVLHCVPSSIVNCTLEAFRDRSRFWDNPFPQIEFAKDDIIHDSFDRNSRTSSFEEGGTNVRSQDSSNKICISN